jgi:hypothetical protein
MAPEVAFTILRAVRTRFWIPLPVPFVSKVHEASQWAKNLHYAPAEEFFNSLSNNWLSIPVLI